MLNLKEIRQLRGKRQDDVARYLNISRAAYTNIENNKRDPDTNVLLLLADYFDVPMDVLFGRAVTYSETDKVHFNLTEAERKLIDGFRSLNEEGQEKLIDYVDDLLQSGKYIKMHPSVMDKEA